MNKFSKLILLMVIFLGTIFTAGCYDRNNGQKPRADGYPITIKTFDGYSGNGQIVEQTFYKPPERVVAMSIATIDNLIFLGLHDKIVGAGNMFGENYKPYENIYKQLPRISKTTAYPSKEAVLLYKPDIIISWGSLFSDNAFGSVLKWHEKGINTYTMINTVPANNVGNRKVEYFIQDLQNISRIFAVEKQSAQLIANLKERLNKIKKATGQINENERPKIVTIQYVYGNEYLARTSSDLTSDIIWLSGGCSLDDQMGSRRSIEHLVKQNPDIILLIDSPTSSGNEKIELLKNNRVLRHVNAVKNNRFLIIDQGAFYCGSIRTLEAIEALHEEINKMR